MFYNARYYDPQLARFVSADSIVPGAATGSGGGAATVDYDQRMALRPLTVDFHEAGFAMGVSAENAFTQAKGFWFQLNSGDRQQAKYQWGPLNPQALDRYSYVLNNPLQYVDPTGHVGLTILPDGRFIVHLSHDDVQELWNLVNTKGWTAAGVSLWLAGKLATIGIKLAAGVLGDIAAVLWLGAGVLRLADWYYGNQGVDVWFNPYQPFGPIALRTPTVSRQHGVYYPDTWVEDGPPTQNPSCPGSDTPCPSSARPYTSERVTRGKVRSFTRRYYAAA